MTERLRITGGSIRNRRLHSPPKNSIRPASDLIRQAAFNMLGTAIAGKVFCDVFAGTGIVGLEALSRGAARAVFVEKDRDMIVLLKRNIALAKFGPLQAAVRQTDAFSWGENFRPDPLGNVVFLGPPYPLFKEDRHAERLQALATALQQRLGDDDLLVYQIPKDQKREQLPDPECWVRVRKYGKSLICIWKRGGADGDPIWQMPGYGDEPEDAAEGLSEDDEEDTPEHGADAADA